jgi:hypothetical protein
VPLVLVFALKLLGGAAGEFRELASPVSQSVYRSGLISPRELDASFGFRHHSTDLRIAGSHSHLARIDSENLQPGA